MKKLWGTAFLLLFTFLATGQKLRPALNLTKGNTYTLILKQTTTTNQTIRERPLETRLILSAKMSFTVTDVQDTLYTVKAKYDSVSLQMDMPNGNLQFSSEHADTANLYSKVLAKLKALPFRLILTRTGKVAAANEAEKNLTEITNTLQVSAAQREQAFKQLQSSLGGNAIVDLLGKLIYIFPPSTINKTDKWVLTNNVDSEIPLMVHNFYFVKNTTLTDITIRGNGTAQTNLTNDTVQLNGMPVKRNLAGNTTSTITINKRNGWPKTAEVTQNLKGNIIVTDNPKLPGGLAIPVAISTTLTVITP
ncbi:DUF6263 family protein [Mucilaginibacter sp. UR6-1]|uniref:DUF6263 family protein n=1 Tax=Mucilaginibacter sp. UR6-1 TaxID=1435643 RepID=UPI001E454BA9|nr:DUF6263 family protein [Mucilaginibacter sp. UR6-1]MCC8408851.1 DUF6263 family protein [Mucilaginibacter sp. UR6-1]